MLGASHFQVPAIKYARDAGIHVITADYLPDNPGHKYANEYYNVSTVDEQKILELAQRLMIDGILAYASDPAAPTAAFVAEKLNLPGNPYESVRILQRKDLFRQHLQSLGLPVPRSRVFSQIEPAAEFGGELLNSNPVVVKPADSSGSKGVTVINFKTEFNGAFEIARSFSRSGDVVVEDFIRKSTYEMDGDGFVRDGALLFHCFGNQHNDVDCNPYVPMGISFPYVQNEKLQMEACRQINQVLKSLDMRIGGLNIEYLTDSLDRIYLLEIGPRNGGNLIPEVIKLYSGVDLIKMAVDSAIGEDIPYNLENQEFGNYASYILHSASDGIVKKIIIDQSISPKVVYKNILVREGDHVGKFNGSHQTLGTFILSFKDTHEMLSLMDRMHELVKVETF